MQRCVPSVCMALITLLVTMVSHYPASLQERWRVCFMPVSLDVSPSQPVLLQGRGKLKEGPVLCQGDRLEVRGLVCLPCCQPVAAAPSHAWPALLLLLYTTAHVYYMYTVYTCSDAGMCGMQRTSSASEMRRYPAAVHPLTSEVSLQNPPNTRVQ